MTALLNQYDNNDNIISNTTNDNNEHRVVEIDDHDVVTMDVDGGIINDTGTGTFSRSSTNSNNTYRYDYKRVSRWSKKVPLKDIFDLDKLFFPINVSNMHWILGIIDMTKKQILILDSFVNDEDTTAVATTNRYARALFQYVSDEYREKKQKHLPNAMEWEIITSSSPANINNNNYDNNTSESTTFPTPQQQNSYDCGVFMCYFATSISIDDPITPFDQRYINDNNGREQIALSILSGKVVL